MASILSWRRPLAGAACVLWLLASGGCTTSPRVVVSAPLRCEDPASRCVNDLLLALEAWKDAYNRRDAQALQRLYAPGALITDDEYAAVPVSGAEVPLFFQDMARRPTARMRWIVGNLQVFGDTAVRSGEFELSDDVAGQPRTRLARYSFAYQRSGGRWLILLQHATLAP